MKIWTICKRELKGYFYSTQAYILIGFFLLLSGFFFVNFLVRAQIPTIQYIMGDWALIFLFITPILTMKLFTEDRKHGMEKMVFSSPVSVTDVVLGKYLAALLVYGAALLVTCSYTIIVSLMGNPDLGPIASSYLGLFLLGSAFISVGVFASSLTENQIIAAVISFSLLLFFWLADLLQGIFKGFSQDIVSLLSVFERYMPFQSGIIALSGIIYYISFTAIFLLLTIRLIKSRWLQ